MKNLLLLSGLGDWFAIESFLTPEQKADVETISWACRGKGALRPLFDDPAVKADYPNLKEHHTLWDDFKKCQPWSKTHLEQLLGTKLPKSLVDMSADVWLPKLQKERTPYQGSTFIKIEADVSRFRLRGDFYSIHATTPFNTESFRRVRDFRQLDWDATRQLLLRRSARGILLNSSNDPEHSDPPFHDLGGTTTLAESITILKRSKGFIGIDSCIGILAAKFFEPKDMQIRAKNASFNVYAPQYLAPHTDLRYVREVIVNQD